MVFDNEVVILCGLLAVFLCDEEVIIEAVFL